MLDSCINNMLKKMTASNVLGSTEPLPSINDEVYHLIHPYACVPYVEHPSPFNIVILCSEMKVLIL